MREGFLPSKEDFTPSRGFYPQSRNFTQKSGFLKSLQRRTYFVADSSSSKKLVDF